MNDALGQVSPVVWLSEVAGGYHNPEARYKIAALEGAGHRVLTVHPIGGASLGPRKALAAGQHLRGFFGRSRSGPAIAGGSEADVRLLISPFRHGRVTTPLNGCLVEQQLRRAFARHGATRPILWFRFPSPELVGMLGQLDESLVVYDLIDYLPNRPLGRRGSRATREAERWLVRRADVVLASSERSMERVRPYARCVHFHPHGVDFDRFAGPQVVPADLATLPRPLIGYTGGDDWIDFPLLEAVCDRFAKATIVIVGPWRENAEARRLFSRTNVHYLGPRPHAEMPAYMAALDVALLPYRKCVEIEYSAPVKITEYLATGRACVATDVPYLHRFGHVMAIEGEQSRFVAAVDAALQGLAPGSIESRRAAVGDDAWPRRNATLVNIIRGALDDEAHDVTRRVGTAVRATRSRGNG